jgi:hypothetical protein
MWPGVSRQVTQSGLSRWLYQALAAVDGWMTAPCRCAARAVPESRREFGEYER